MNVDPVFPLPSPDFLWVHNLGLTPHDAGATITDPDTGKWRYIPGVPTFTRGYLTAPSRNEQTRADSTTVRVDAVARFPHGTVGATEKATLTCNPQPGVTAWQVGTYEVTAVHPTAVDLRLLLTRTDGEPTPNA